MPSSSLERVVARLDAESKIRNLMGRYSYLLTAAKYHDIVDLFAHQAPDVRAEMSFGIYDGIEGIRRCYSKFHAEKMIGPGVMTVLPLTTPVIEVAGDGQTAKAVWISPGHVTGGPFTPDGSIKAHWAWMRYGNDFILEDGQWKIWHLHVFGMFLCSFEKSWAEGDVHQSPSLPPEYAPDRPPTTTWAYRPDVETILQPVPPLPYEVFDPATAY